MEGDGGLRTLECLRGRLLAERQASRVAKEDAELMGNKVALSIPCAVWLYPLNYHAFPQYGLIHTIAFIMFLLSMFIHNVPIV